MKSRKQISKELSITEQYLSMLLSGERKVSWPMAEKLSYLFPGRSLKEWKNSTPEELNRALSQIERETA